MGKNVPTEEQLLQSITAHKPIKPDVALAAALKIKRLKCRINELMLERGKLIAERDKLKVSNEQAEIVAQTLAELRMIDSIEEAKDVGEMLERFAKQAAPARSACSNPCSEVTLGDPKPCVLPTPVPGFVPEPQTYVHDTFNPNDMTLIPIWAVYVQHADGQREPTEGSQTRVDANWLIAKALEDSLTTDKIWFIEFKVPGQWSDARKYEYLTSMERQATAFTNYSHGRREALAKAESLETVTLNSQDFANAFTAMACLFEVLDDDHPICQTIRKYQFTSK